MFIVINDGEGGFRPASHAAEHFCGSSRINWHHSYADFFVPIAFSALVICAAFKDGLISKVLSTPIFQFLGNISTSLLLTQLVLFQYFGIFLMPLLPIANTTLCQIICIAIQILWAWIIHVLVEKNGLKLLLGRLQKGKGQKK